MANRDKEIRDLLRVKEVEAECTKKLSKAQLATPVDEEEVFEHICDKFEMGLKKTPGEWKIYLDEDGYGWQISLLSETFDEFVAACKFTKAEIKLLEADLLGSFDGMEYFRDDDYFFYGIDYVARTVVVSLEDDELPPMFRKIEKKNRMRRAPQTVDLLRGAILSRIDYDAEDQVAVLLDELIEKVKEECNEG
jgi:hypothetical protein